MHHRRLTGDSYLHVAIIIIISFIVVVIIIIIIIPFAVSVDAKPYNQSAVVSEQSGPSFLRSQCPAAGLCPVLLSEWTLISAVPRCRTMPSIVIRVDLNICSAPCRTLPSSFVPNSLTCPQRSVTAPRCGRGPYEGHRAESVWRVDEAVCSGDRTRTRNA